MLAREAVPTSMDVEMRIKAFMQGTYVGERLSFGLKGEGSWKMPSLPAGLGKSDRPG